MSHTNVGNYTFDPDTANLPLKSLNQQVIGTYKTEQSNERNNIIQYLNEKNSTYTLWKGKRQINPTSNMIDFI